MRVLKHIQNSVLHLQRHSKVYHPCIVITLGLLLVLCVGCAPKSDFTFHEFAFPDIMYYAVSDYTGTSEAVTIPSEHNGCEVRYVLSDSFFHAGMKALDLGSVVDIRDEAFTFCTRLKTLDLGHVETIGRHAFDSCNSLESVTIPDTVKKIYAGAFQRCLSLKEAYFMGDPEIMGEVIFDAGVIIYGTPGGTVERYALENGYEFRSLEN